MKNDVADCTEDDVGVAGTLILGFTFSGNNNQHKLGEDQLIIFSRLILMNNLWSRHIFRDEKTWGILELESY